MNRNDATAQRERDVYTANVFIPILREGAKGAKGVSGPHAVARRARGNANAMEANPHGKTIDHPLSSAFIGVHLRFKRIPP
jgi:hypothetical protein